MFRVAGIGVLAAAAAGPNLQPISSALELILGGGIIVGLVALYKARSEKNLNSTQAMALLFEKQREVNLDQIKQHDLEMQRIQDELDHSKGGNAELVEERAALRRRLAECQRERTVLKNQIAGLEATLADLHHRRQTD